MKVYVLTHYGEFVGVYSSAGNADLASRSGHVGTLERQGFHVQEVQLDLGVPGVGTYCMPTLK